MFIFISVILFIALIIFAFDYVDIFLNWLGRIKIGSIYGDDEWKNATENVIKKWLLGNTPSLPVNENKRFKLISLIKNGKKIESTSFWQDAAVLKAAEKLSKDDTEAFINEYVDSEDGEWLVEIDRIDAAMLAYEMMCSDAADNQMIKPAMDYIAAYLKGLYEKYGTIPYNENVKDVRFVDTIGMVCPFLMKYAVVYNKPEFVDMALDQIKEYKKYGFDKETKIPYHCFNAETKAPLGICGWGRGCAWWAMGITDSLRVLMSCKSYNAEKILLLKYCIEFMTLMKKYQRSDGAFTRMIFTESLEDSSAGAMLAYCFAYLHSLTDNDDFEACCKNILKHLKTCTRRNGVIDYAQGDTMGIGFYSDSLRVVPAAQGFAVAAAREIDF